MVGRELPNLRPYGEDHRGAGGGEPTGMLRLTDDGMVTSVWRNWLRKKTMIRIHKALGLLLGLRLVLSAILFDLRVSTWVIGNRMWFVGDVVGKRSPKKRTRRTRSRAVKRTRRILRSSLLICLLGRERRPCFSRPCTALSGPDPGAAMMSGSARGSWQHWSGIAGASKRRPKRRGEARSGGISGLQCRSRNSSLFRARRGHLLSLIR